jgi:hypothetical protein
MLLCALATAMRFPLSYGGIIHTGSKGLTHMRRSQQYSAPSGYSIVPIIYQTLLDVNGFFIGVKYEKGNECLCYEEMLCEMKGCYQKRIWR